MAAAIVASATRRRAISRQHILRPARECQARGKPRKTTLSRRTMDLALRDQVVLVTGAGQGLGRSIGLAFAREGAHVAFHYHSSTQGAEAAANEAQVLVVKAIAVGTDLRDDAAVTVAVEGVERELGPIAVLVNNAAATRRQPFLDST